MLRKSMAQTYTRRAARTLLAASVGIVLLEAGARRPVPEEGVPILAIVRPIRLEATALRRGAGGTAFSHGKDDDQPAGACWLASVGGAPPSCLCSAGTIEDLITPDYMRTQLGAWRDAGSLTTSEWRERLLEVHLACPA